ncbi:MAG: DUF89 family protein [Deltaproteobacteria bacterium]|nr:DUF89 family protein [Deltaproteobacteria bacterium]
MSPAATPPPPGRAIPGPECPACLARLVSQALSGVGLAPDDASPLGEALRETARAGLAAGRPPALTATEFLAQARQMSGVDDPFRAQKQADLARAARAAARLANLPNLWPVRARAAILGNALDHFAAAGAEALWQEGQTLHLGVDDLAAAEAYLRPGARVVILADNAGEQAFDRLLAGHLLARGCRVSYVVKSRPVQNDLTLADLLAAGEDHGLGEIRESGTGQVGLDPAGAPPELGERLAGADLVIAKGMGHYETLAPGVNPHALALAPTLFLFLAKCRPVARSLGVAPGAGVALMVKEFAA